MSMTWKKWRIGFWLALFLGTLSAGAGLCVGMAWQAFVAVLCTSIATHIGAYLMRSPLDAVEDETEPKKYPDCYAPYGGLPPIYPPAPPILKKSVHDDNSPATRCED